MQKKEWYSASEIAGLPTMPLTERGVRIRAESEGWLSRARNEQGGGNEYHFSFLPDITMTYIVSREMQIARAKDPYAEAGGMEGRRLAVAAAIEAKIEDEARGKGLAELPALSHEARRRTEARLAILSNLDNFVMHSGLPPARAVIDFCDLYAAGQVDIDPWAREVIREVHPTTIYRWRRSIKTEGAASLAGRYGNRRGASKIDQQPELRHLILSMLTDHPHTKASHIMMAIRARFSGNGIEIPSSRALERWVARWKKENKQLFTSVSNPDAWKSKYMTAFGSASAGIDRLNQLWEFDSTPADVMLLDGRHSVIGVIDVFSRRSKLLVTKTSKATAIALICRRALLSWGVPEEAKTDNGQDYTSLHVRRVFQSLAIQHTLCTPFSPWEKPHIERFFKTFAHDLVELLGGYIGHSVSDRKAIESRHSFSEQLMKKDQVVDVRMSSQEFQSFCDRWVEDIYHHQAHNGLDGKTPFQVTTEWRGDIRRITDERALDVLLAEAPGDGLRTVRTKGIQVDTLNYIHEDLTPYIGEKVRVLYDPDDIGRIYVFGGDPMEFICIAECPEITGISRREIAAYARQKQKAEIQQARAELKAMARKENTRDIAEEILAHAAEQSRKLIAFPHPAEPHESAGLAAAGDAVAAREALGSPAIPAPVDEASHRRVVELMRDDDEPDETPEDRFNRYLELSDRSGDITDDERSWMGIYETTSEYRTYMMMLDEFGTVSGIKYKGRKVAL